MKKHTPGPWVLDSPNVDLGITDSRLFHIDDPRRGRPSILICTFEGDASNDPDAHLIAAAPELLLVLKKIVQKGPDACHDLDLIDLAKEIINKAEGDVK